MAMYSKKMAMGANIYLTEKVTLNRYVLRLHLYCQRYDKFLIPTGETFHNV